VEVGLSVTGVTGADPETLDPMLGDEYTGSSVAEEPLAVWPLVKLLAREKVGLPVRPLDSEPAVGTVPVLVKPDDAPLRDETPVEVAEPVAVEPRELIGVLPVTDASEMVESPEAVCELEP